MRVVLADDHQMFREGLRALLEREGFDVVGEAADGRTAVELAQDRRPEAVILDLDMSELNGIDATRSLARHSPGTPVEKGVPSPAPGFTGDRLGDLPEAGRSYRRGRLRRCEGRVTSAQTPTRT